MKCSGLNLYQHIVLLCSLGCGVLPRKLSFTVANLWDETLTRKPHNVQQNASHYKSLIDCAADCGNITVLVVSREEMVTWLSMYQNGASHKKVIQ
jgi:hypothetical protein